MDALPRRSVDLQMGPSMRTVWKRRLAVGAVERVPERGQRDERVLRAVKRGPDQLAHAGIEDHGRRLATTDVQNARDDPAARCDDGPARLDRNAGRPRVGGNRSELGGRGLAEDLHRWHGPGLAEGDREAATGIERVKVGQARALQREQPEAEPKRGSPRIDRAELRSDVQLDAAPAQRAPAPTTRFDHLGQLARRAPRTSIRARPPRGCHASPAAPAG